MTKKKNNPPDDLIGFQEFIDSSDMNLNQIKRPERAINENYSLLTFLESESNRLGKTIQICEEQAFILKEYQQHTSILKKQDQMINKNKAIIVELLKRKDSPLSKNLKELLSLHFDHS